MLTQIVLILLVLNVGDSVPVQTEFLMPDAETCIDRAYTKLEEARQRADGRTYVVACHAVAIPDTPAL